MLARAAALTRAALTRRGPARALCAEPGEQTTKARVLNMPWFSTRADVLETVAHLGAVRADHMPAHWHLKGADRFQLNGTFLVQADEPIWTVRRNVKLQAFGRQLLFAPLAPQSRVFHVQGPGVLVTGIPKYMTMQSLKRMLAAYPGSRVVSTFEAGDTQAVAIRMESDAQCLRLMRENHGVNLGGHQVVVAPMI